MTARPPIPPQGDASAEVTAELEQLADLLEPLDDESWNVPSLCEGWRVREVVAHVTMPTRWRPARLFREAVRHRFRFDVLFDHVARDDAASLSTSALLAALRSPELAAWRPPGGGAEGALVHAVVHGLDITTPLGIDRELPATRMRLVLDALTTRRSLRHFEVDLDGIELRADDAGWCHGSRSPLHTDAADAVLMLTGRRPLPRVSGPAG